jgi:hypothetical protein
MPQEYALFCIVGRCLNKAPRNERMCLRCQQDPEYRASMGRILYTPKEPEVQVVNVDFSE